MKKLLLSLSIALFAGAVAAPFLLHDHAAHAQTGETWVCPMHPEVVRDGPGKCPICGMFLKQKEAPKPAPKKAAPKKATSTRSAPKKAPKEAVPEAATGHTDGHEGHDHAAHAMPEVEPAAPVDPNQVWVCPMHPNVVESREGTCPICGMDLVPQKKEAEKTPAPEARPKTSRKILHWVAPMDPTYIRDEPGKSPMGMDLVPVYADEGGAATVKVDPVMVQNMGVRIALVRQAPIYRTVRTLGEVTVAEDRLGVVNPRYSGWIETIHVDETGVFVRKGDPLFDVYAPEVVAASEELVVALRTSGSASALAKSARRRLEFLGLSDAQIDRIGRTRQVKTTFTETAPRSGYVIHKNVVAGARVMAGQDLYRIADLSRVWVEADVYEADAPWMKVGAAVRVDLTFQPGTPRRGAVTYVYPTLREKSRTLRIRVELDNPDLALKPGMFATVHVEAERKEGALVVPSEAILYSGTRKLVFLALSLGRYAPRELQTGLSGDNGLTEVIAGLSEGERVVTSGQFLLDSESQLREAVAKLLARRLHADSPEAGVDGLKSTGEQKQADTYWTCSMHPEVVQDGPGECPICGMNLVEKER